MNAQSIVNAIGKFYEFLMPVNHNGLWVLLPIFQIVLLIMGLVKLFKPDERKIGVFVIADSILYILGIFLIENGYLPIFCVVFFAIVAIALGLMILWENVAYDKKTMIISLIVYSVVLIVLVTVQIFVSKQNITEYFDAITVMQWGYIAMFVSMGIRHLHIGVFALMLIFTCFTSFFTSSGNDDQAFGATGDEQSVDTVSMSD